MIWLKIVEAAATAGCLTVASLKFLHMLQLESYQLPGYKRYLSSHPQAMRGMSLIAGAASAAVLYYYAKIFSLEIKR